jgi:5-methylcytosine-specific restriction endonuclease McrA
VSLSERQQRRQDEPTYEERIRRIADAQEGLCSICCQILHPRLIISKFDDGWSFEHVFPKARYRHLLGNLLIAHKRCNREKGARDPTGCEILLLHAVNAKLGRELAYRDEAPVKIELPVVAAPSALAIALSQLQR